MTENKDLDFQIEKEGEILARVTAMMGKRLVGQKNVAERLLMGLLCDGHVLLEGLPGLAKTTAVKALGDTSDLMVRRIQFTPDLLPADVIGNQIYNPKEGQFSVKKGPIFCNLLIADEINRAPAKVQSALLEAMQEKQVTLGDETFQLDSPFLVMATQNPIEQEGTYPLPEAQVDRFLFKLRVDYGTMAEEQEVMKRMASGGHIPLEEVLNGGDILRMRSLLDEIYVSDQIRQYIIRLVFATRAPEAQGIRELKGMIHVGASPRASINMEKAARAHALMRGRSYVVPQDIKDVGADILRHRILPTYEAEAEHVTSEHLIEKLFERVDVP